MLTVPKLDTQSFKEIYEIMSRVMDSSLPQPPDASYQDPGRTLIDLFALLFDMQRFYMDFITDEHKEQYARLLGGKTVGMKHASAMLEVLPKEGVSALPRGFTVYAGNVPFETDEYFEVSQNRLEHFKWDEAGHTLDLGFTKDLSMHPIRRIYLNFDKPVEPLTFSMEHWEGRYLAENNEWREIEIFDKHVSGGFLNIGVKGAMLKSGEMYRLNLVMISDFETSPRVTDVRINAVGAHQLKTWCSYTDVAADTDGGIRLDSFLALYGRIEIYGFHEDNTCKELDSSELDIDRRPETGLTHCRVKAKYDKYRVVCRAKEFTGEMLSNGTPNQAVPLPATGMDEDVLEIMPSNGGGVYQTNWKRVGNFYGSTGKSRHFRSGSAICFGNGERGAIPPAGTLKIIRCVSSIGGDGNVREIKTDVAVSITPATGGENKRGIIIDNKIKKAVTLEDYITLLQDIPVLELDRVSATVESWGNPRNKNGETAVCLHIKPVSADPLPGLNDAYIKNILAYLEPFRTVAAKVMACAAEYVPFSLKLDAEYNPGFWNPEEMIVKKLAEHFPYKGFVNGVRREFGERITYSEIYGHIRSVSCINRINSLRLYRGGDESGEDVFIQLLPNQLGYLKHVMLEPARIAIHDGFLR